MITYQVGYAFTDGHAIPDQYLNHVVSSGPKFAPSLSVYVADIPPLHNLSMAQERQERVGTGTWKDKRHNICSVLSRNNQRLYAF